MKWHNDGTQANRNQIFVFGSNLAGIHGAGAAKQAVLKYGAKYGQGVGFRGKSFAIPTKDYDIVSLPLATIAQYISNFVKLTREASDTEFFVTRIGCGLAGFADKDIAPLFKGCGDNCDLPVDWQPYLQFN